MWLLPCDCSAAVVSQQLGSSCCLCATAVVAAPPLLRVCTPSHRRRTPSFRRYTGSTLDAQPPSAVGGHHAGAGVAESSSARLSLPARGGPQVACGHPHRGGILWHLQPSAWQLLPTLHGLSTWMRSTLWRLITHNVILWCSRLRGLGPPRRRVPICVTRGSHCVCFWLSCPRTQRFWVLR